MKTSCYIDIPARENGHGVAVRRLLVNDSFQVMHLTLKPGEVVELHTTQVDVFFYVLEGQCYVQIGQEKELVSKDTLVESPASIPHGLSNESHAKVRVMVVKTRKTGRNE